MRPKPYRRYVLAVAAAGVFGGGAFAQSTSGDLQSPSEYDSAIRENAEAAEAMQGPLEGGWVVAAANGPKLYRLELSAPVQGAMTAEGAWRDLSVKPGPVSAGLIAGAGLEAGKLVIRFTETGPTDRVELALAPAGKTLWRGALIRGGRSVPVIMQRD